VIRRLPAMRARKPSLAAPGPARVVPAAVALGVLAAAAWVVLAAGLVEHPSHDALLGHGHAPSRAMLGAFLLGWLLMVVAMMLPASIPAVLARARDTAARRLWAATAGLVVATCAVWSGFAMVTLAGDAVVHRVVDSWHWLGEREVLVAAAVLVLAGMFHLSPLQRRLLDAARRPPRHLPRHALSCLGSCGALMLVMFAVGVGSLLWMAVLTLVMTVEHGARSGPRLVPIAGIALVLLGAATALG